MTETTAFNYVNIGNICRVCYRSDLGVHLASFEELSAIQTLNLQPYFPSMNPLYFCVYCAAILKKSVLFVKQCYKASKLFSPTSKENTSFESTYYNNMSIETFDTTSYPIYTSNEEIKEEVADDHEVDGDHHFGDDDDLPLTMLKDEEDPTNTLKISEPINPIRSSNEKIKVEAASDLDVDDDHPLTMLKDEEILTEKVTLATSPSDKHKIILKKKKRKLKATKNTEDNSHDIKTKTIAVTKNIPADDRPHIAAGVKGNGSVFSKRMVRETEQYLVIKLTKDEVLQEMHEKLLSEKYLTARHKCEKCVKQFNFEDVLRNHMEKHSKKGGNLLCDLCKQYLPNPVSLRGHMKSHTTRYKCKLCGIIQKSRQNLLEHYTLSHCGDSVKYTCDLCTFVTNKRTTIQRHARSHWPSKGHICDMCGRSCKTLEALRVHRIRHDASKQFQCPTCPRRFVYPTLLKRHVREAHELAHNYCVECDQTFSAKESLQNHFKRSKKHRVNPAYECKSCSAKFESRRQLTSHRTRDHQEPSVTYQCNSCPKKYQCKDTLKSHIRRVHTELVCPKVHTCNQCDKEFAQKYSLTRHLRTHTDAPRRRHITHTKKPESKIK